MNLGTTPFAVQCFKASQTDVEIVSQDNPLPVSATLDVGDINIGAVEIQDASSGNRAAVDASGRLSVDGSGVTQPISAAALPLPTGAASSANQTTAISALGNIVTNTALISAGNASLASIDGKIVTCNTGAITFAVPQHVIVDSGAFSITGSITVSSITNPVAVTGPLTDVQLRAAAVTTSVSGNVAVTNAGLTNLDVALSTRLKPADTLAAVTAVGTVTTVSAVTSITNPVAVTNAGLTNIDVALSTRLKPADTLAAVTTVGTVTTVSAVTSITNPVAVTGPLTNAELRASDVGVTASALEIEQGISAADIVGPMVQGVVNDAPTSPFENVIAPLSLTKQGRLRVATVIEDVGVSFTSVGEARMWNDQNSDFSQSNAPWSAW